MKAQMDRDDGHISDSYQISSPFGEEPLFQTIHYDPIFIPTTCLWLFPSGALQDLSSPLLHLLRSRGRQPLLVAYWACLPLPKEWAVLVIWGQVLMVPLYGHLPHLQSLGLVGLRGPLFASGWLFCTCSIFFSLSDSFIHGGGMYVGRLLLCSGKKMEKIHVCQGGRM